MITTKSNNKFTVVSIEKYSNYQEDKRKFEQQNNNKITTNEQQNNTNNNVKNVNNIKNIYSDYPEELKKALDSFAEMRKKIKSPLTEKGMQLALNKLKKLSTNEVTQIEIINEAVLKCWKSFYPLKQEQKNKNNYEQRQYNACKLNNLYANKGGKL
jgi:hypothetical protein